ncbi:MAG: tRNA (adenine-N1)-methyltransferase [Thermoplasmata archaeon]
MSSSISNNDIFIEKTIALVSLSSKQNSSPSLIFKIKEGIQSIKGFGTIDTNIFSGKHFGDEITIAGQRFIILQPSLQDIFSHAKRGPQVIIQKDAALIILYSNIGPGSKVVELGMGAGFLTICLLNAVGKEGCVVSYELRQDHIEIAKKNISFLGEGYNHVIKNKDAYEGIEEEDFDAVVSDIPEPWRCIASVKKVLKPGGFFTAYLPTVNQVEKLVVSASKELNYITTFETLFREYNVKEEATRPSFEMLGHTGFITVFRKIY